MSTRRGLAVIGMGVCAGSVAAPAPSSIPPSSSALQASPLLPPNPAFVPPSANPARKAKLLALQPQLDELYCARLAETGATGAAIGIVLEGEPV